MAFKFQKLHFVCDWFASGYKFAYNCLETIKNHVRDRFQAFANTLLCYSIKICADTLSWIGSWLKFAALHRIPFGACGFVPMPEVCL